MNSHWTVESLKAFEADIAAEFNAGKIRSPVHLEDGNEENLLRVFKEIKPEDWIFCSWRSHLKCLLKGVPPAELKAAIMAGRSIALCFPEYRIVSSAIVGGNIPIALGVALAIKRAKMMNHVWCFVGDMTWHTGISIECEKYSRGFDLPLTFIMEDNDKSVCTPTAEVWGWDSPIDTLIRYSYESKYPHCGAGHRVQF